PVRDGAEARLRRTDPGDRGVGRWRAGRNRTGQQASAGVAPADASRAGRWMLVPRLWPPPMAARAPHRPLGRRRPDRRGQPDALVRLSPPARARARMEGRTAVTR